MEAAPEAMAPAGADPRDARPFGLDWLIAPIAGTAFLREHWERAPLFVAREDPSYFRDLPGLDAVDELITATASGPARTDDEGRIVRTDRNGVLSERAIALGANGVPDIQDVYRAYDGGHTIVLNQIHRRSAAVALLCRALQEALQHRIGANLYLTPRAGQGFLAHVDTHDVFILQLHGEKLWRVGRPAHALPLRGARSGRIELDDPAEYRLRPGDVLYLPRGAPHEALTAATSSLHLTVGIYVYRWVDLLTEALGELAEEEVQLRTALPAGFLDRPLDARHATQLADDLVVALAGTDLLARAQRRLGAKLLRSGRAAAGGHFRSLDAVAELCGESVVARAPGVLCRVGADPDTASIEFDTNYVSGPAALRPALDFVAQHERFAVCELPGELSTEDKVDLVRRLVAEGLLIFIDHGNGGRRDG